MRRPVRSFRVNISLQCKALITIASKTNVYPWTWLYINTPKDPVIAYEYLLCFIGKVPHWEQVYFLEAEEAWLYKEEIILSGLYPYHSLPLCQISKVVNKPHSFEGEIPLGRHYWNFPEHLLGAQNVWLAHNSCHNHHGQPILFYHGSVPAECGSVVFWERRVISSSARGAIQASGVPGVPGGGGEWGTWREDRGDRQEGREPRGFCRTKLNFDHSQTLSLNSEGG